MRAVRYNVVSSLDGYIGGPNGEYDWIPDDPTVDFPAIFARFDTFLLGRGTYDLVRSSAAPPWPDASRVHVFSRTLRPEDHPGITVVSNNAAEVVAKLRTEEGRDIWLFGGGVLFGSLLAAGQVDAVEVTVAPVLVGGGIPLLPPAASRTMLTFTGSHVYPSGMVTLQYDIRQQS